MRVRVVHQQAGFRFLCALAYEFLIIYEFRHVVADRRRVDLHICFVAFFFNGLNHVWNRCPRIQERLYDGVRLPIEEQAPKQHCLVGVRDLYLHQAAALLQKRGSSLIFHFHGRVLGVRSYPAGQRCLQAVLETLRDLRAPRDSGFSHGGIRLWWG